MSPAPTVKIIPRGLTDSFNCTNNSVRVENAFTRPFPASFSMSEDETWNSFAFSRADGKIGAMRQRSLFDKLVANSF